MEQDTLKAVILFGPPGSGKGTQAELLSTNFGFFHLDSSKTLEEWFRHVKGDDYVEIEGKKYYVKWGFKRVGQISKDTYVKRGEGPKVKYGSAPAQLVSR